MPSRAESTPTPAELLVWLRLASPRTARGRYRWSPGTERWIGGFAHGGPRPVVTSAPADVEMSFWHAGPDRWRIDAPDGPLCVSDGEAAAVWSGGGVEVGGALLVLTGPAQLLMPDPREWPGEEPGGTVERAELLGRLCWRWEQEEGRRWVDDRTGCLLRLEERGSTAELTALETDVDLDLALFALPPGVAPPEPLTAPPAETGPRKQAPAFPFVVPWWPLGTGAHPEAGDAEVPEVLLALHTASETGPQLWLGIAPAGRAPRVQRRCRSRQWDGDGWSFALSWEGEVADDEIERVIASVPRTWDGAGS